MAAKGYKEQYGNNKHRQADKNTAASEREGNTFLQALLHNGPRLFLYQKICILLAAFLVFANGIPNGFNMDDIYYTTPNNPVSNMGIKALPQIFTSHTLYDVTGNNFDYRPIPMATFAIQHQLIGSAPAASHFISVLIYAMLCLLIFILLSGWFGAPGNWAAFFAALLYAVHPLHTEVVDSIKNRDELLAAVFGMLSLLFAWKWYKNNSPASAVYAVLCFLAGVLCKLTIMSYLALVPLAFYFFTEMPLKRIVASVLVLLATYIIAYAVIHQLLPEEKRTFLFLENPLYAVKQPAGIITATAAYILGWYAYLHLIPYPLSFYYGYEYVQLMSWGNLLPLLSLLVYVALLILVIKYFRKKNLLAFGTLFYFFNIIAYANLASPVPGMMAERFTFASSLGYCILVAAFIAPPFSMRAPAAGKNSSYALVIFFILFTAYTAMTIARNTDWKDSITLYSHDIGHLQRSAKANMLYGEQILQRNNRLRQEFNRAGGPEKQLYRDSLLQFIALEKAPFLRVLQVAPDYSRALNNLAVAYINDDSLEEAKKYLLRSVTAAGAQHADATTYYNLGIVYGNMATKTGNQSLADSSVIALKTAVSINPRYAAAYDRLGLIYLGRKDTAAALNIFITATQNIPDESSPYIEVAELFLYKRDTVQAISYYEKGAAVPHANPVLFQLLQNYYHNKNNLQKESYYRSRLNEPK